MCWERDRVWALSRFLSANFGASKRVFWQIRHLVFRTRNAVGLGEIVTSVGTLFGAKFIDNEVCVNGRPVLNRSRYGRVLQ